ncbi:hypothetical protein ACF06X_33055 [Streptomyces sp. NPDC015346]|uniref:hypothetical protein n=1 Tax=Streptomyces sp. NPDC015346 TaxID=3364954 RepID=UPI0036F8AA0D
MLADRAALPQRLTRGLDGLADLVAPLPEHLLADRRLMAAVRTPLLADLLVLLYYQHRKEPPMDVPLALFGGDEDRGPCIEDLFAWNHLVTGAAEARLFTSGHMYLPEQAEDLVGQLSSETTSVVGLAV